jgi:hypothetical protein
MGDVCRVCQGVFDCGHGHPRRRADAFCHRPNRTLTEAARLTDHFDGNKVRDLNRFAVDRNVAYREPLHRGYLEGRSEGVAGIAAQDLPARLRIRSIRRLPTISRKFADVKGHGVGDADVGLLSSKLVYLGANMRVAIAFRIAKSRCNCAIGQ